MTTSSIDLAKLFGTVAKTMVQNKAALNAADEYNHDHGDHMAEIFQTVTQAVKAKAGATPAQQLAYASQLLQQKTTSGSGKLYAENLADASAKLGKAKAVTQDNAMDLLKSLLGASDTVSAQAPAGGAGGDLLGSLLGGLTGTSGSSAGAGGDLLGSLLGGAAGGSSGSSAGAGGDLLGSLLGSLAGGGAATGTGSQSGQQGIDIGTLLQAGMAFAQAKQSGRTNLDAILSAIMASSKMNTSPARSQSGALVANTLLQALGKMAAAR